MKLVKIEAHENTDGRNFDYVTWVNPKQVVRVVENGALATIILTTTERIQAKSSVKRVVKKLED